MEDIKEFLDELYLADDSMANKINTLTSEQYKRLKSLGLPSQNGRVTMWRAIKYLENYDGSNNDSSTTDSN